MIRPPMALIAAWAALVIPSWAIVDRMAGWPGVVAYSSAAALALLLAPRLFARVPRPAVRPLAIATLVAVTVVFLLVFPKVNSHLPSTGSDDDDAHDVGVAALLAGESPYTRETYLGNQLHQLPGSYVLAAPFVLLGTSALQNLFWLPLLYLVAASSARDARTPLVLAWLILGLSPVVMHQVVTGSSYAANTTSVLLGMWWLTRAPTFPVAAIFWGVALCSRANFLLLVPMVLGWLCYEVGWRLAVRQMALTSVTVAALAVPFLSWREDSGPLAAWERMARFDNLMPYTGLSIVAVMASLAAVLAFARVDRFRLLRNSALVQAFPVLIGLLLAPWSNEPGLSLAFYGSFAAWFTFLGILPQVEPWLSGSAGASPVSASSSS
jgi:hypothetical protein